MTRLSSLSWTHEAPWFGGFSAIEMDADGQTGTVLTDKGHMAKVQFNRNRRDEVVGMSVLSNQPMRSPSGRALVSLRSDAEGLAMAPDGSAYVSFEQRHRILKLDPATAATRPHAAAPAQASFAPNKGFEALALSPDGTLYAASENRVAGQNSFDLMLYRDGTWQVGYRIAHRGRFVPVGADFDAQGRLYLLERSTTPVGFQSRVRRFDPAAGRLAQTVLLVSRPGQFSNLEGLSVWTDNRGRTRLTMISDDNFSRLLRTQVVEYAVQ